MLDAEAELATPGLLDPQWRPPLVEAALEQDEAALEVVAERRQLQRRIQTHLAVGELRPARVEVIAQQPVEDPTRDALDQVVAVDERAAVNRVEANHGRRGRRGRRPGRRGGAR